MKKIFTLIIILLMTTSLQLHAAESFNHSLWSVLLSLYVKNGQVDYSGLAGNSDHLRSLDKYLASLATAKPDSFSREGQLAFWINAYNAFTVKLILDNLPVDSIRKIPGAWKKQIWQAGGEKLSLDEIEHQILRPMGEPRIHFAIVCASISCPDLAGEAFNADRLEEQLQAVTERFLSQDKGMVMTVDKGKHYISISKIFSWFARDFVTKSGSVPKFIREFGGSEAQAFIDKGGKKLKIKYLPYDWNLNGR